jgi:hypothetical protein
MKKLSREQKEQLQNMIDQHDKEQGKKRKDYQKFRRKGGKLISARPLSDIDLKIPAVETSRYHMDGEQRLEHMEKKHRQAKKDSEARRIRLTKEQKEELRKKLQGSNE